MNEGNKWGLKPRAAMRAAGTAIYCRGSLPLGRQGHLQVGGSAHCMIDERLTSLSILARLGASEGRSDAIH